MIIPYGYIANGFKPQTVLGLGFIVRRYGTDSNVVIVPGPFRSVAYQSYSPGSKASDSYSPNSAAGQGYSPGSQAGEAV